MKNSALRFLLIVLFVLGCSRNADSPGALARRSEELYKKSSQAYQKLLANDAENAGIRLELARLYYNHGDYPAAIKTLGGQDNAGAQKMLAYCFYKSGDYTQALVTFERLGELDDPEYLYYYGLTCQKQNLFERALGLFSKVSGKEYVIQASQRASSIQGMRQGYSQGLGLELKKAAEEATQEKYPLAGAAIVLSDERMRVLPENMIVSEEHFVVKILNERGKKDFSEVIIGYDSTYERVEIDYARTIKPDGEVVIVGEKDIRDVSRYLDFPLYSNARARIISMPEIGEGSIIEYKYRLTQNQLINKKDFNLAYSLQENEPIIRARFSLSMPIGRELKIKILNPEYNLHNFNLAPNVSENKDEKTYLWEFNGIPQIEAEPLMPPAAEINPIILLSTFSSWEDIYSWWWELVRDRAVADSAIEEKARELTSGKKNNEDKIRAIYNYCAEKIRYVGVEYGQAGYQPHKAEEIFKNKYGDCKDKAILFVAMLKAAGIEGYPVLIGTRGTPALQQDFPATIFNHCIAAVELDGKMMFLDITAEVCSFGDLPEGDQERKVLLFRNDGYELMDTPLLGPEANRLQYKTAMALTKDGFVRANRTVETSGQFDQGQRYWLRYTPANLIEDGLKEKIQDMVVSGRLLKYNYKNKDDLNLPIRLDYEYEGNNFLSRAGRLRLMPQFAYFDTSAVAKEERRYSLELGQPDISESLFDIVLPENFSVKYLPDAVDSKSPWLDYLVSYTLEGAHLRVRQRQVQKTRQVPKDEYRAYKKFAEGLAIKLDEHVVLEQKNGQKKRER